MNWNQFKETYPEGCSVRIETELPIENQHVLKTEEIIYILHHNGQTMSVVHSRTSDGHNVNKEIPFRVMADLLAGGIVHHPRPSSINSM